MSEAENVYSGAKRQSAWGQVRLVAYAVWIMLMTEVGLWLMPFYRLRQWVTNLRLAKWNEKKPSVQQVRRAIGIAGRYLPHATCLVIALSCQVLLKRYGHPSCLHVGVACSDGTHLEPHAWVESEGDIIVGDDGHLDEYRQLIPPVDVTAD